METNNTTPEIKITVIELTECQKEPPRPPKPPEPVSSGKTFPLGG